MTNKPKKKSKIIRLAMFIAVTGSLILFLAPRSNEPTYHDRRLSYWLEKLYYGGDEGRLEAERAIRGMGTNTIPFLIRMLPERDAAWKNAYNTKVAELFGYDWSGAQPFLIGGRSSLAARGLGIVGPAAREAVPFLIENMTNFPLSASSPSEYDIALCAIGADSVLPLVRALSHPDPGLRTHATLALSHADHTNLVRAVPELIALLKSSDGDTREHATQILGHVPGDARVPLALIECLKDKEEDVRRRAAIGLGFLGTEAKPALPTLIELLKTSDTNFLANISFAIEGIDTNLVVEGTRVRRRTE